MSDPEVRNVLVTGANGYIGSAVARAFARAGWITYGLIRKASSSPSLATNEIISIIGSAASLPSLPANLHFSVIVSTTEQHPDYISHYLETITLVRNLASRSGPRPLVIFTSGCKDYGMSPFLAGDADLNPDTEDKVLRPPPFAVDRAAYASKIFENEDVFDAVLVRPTNVYGGTGSFYGGFFALAAEGKEKAVLELKENPKTVLHAVHVDDCGDAYVAIASASRSVTAGQVYNISSYRYETLDEIAHALVKEYEIPGGVKDGSEGAFEDGASPERFPERMLLGFSQWTSSEKLRRDTGWKDRRLLFSRGLRQYRLAYEEGVKVEYKPLDMKSLKA